MARFENMWLAEDTFTVTRAENGLIFEMKGQSSNATPMLVRYVAKDLQEIVGFMESALATRTVNDWLSEKI